MDSAYQQLETKLENLTQELVILFNQQQGQSHQVLDQKIELLNSSTQEHFTQLDNRTPQLSGETRFLFNPTSCAALPSSSSSGYYWILPSTGPPAVQVYCDFNRQCGCGGSNAWTRVAFLNPNEVCPSNWETYTSPVRACGNGQTSPNGGCGSVIYPAYGLRYTSVCGRVIGYQHSDTIAFNSLTISRSSIEQHYLDGVSITHGGAGSRQHIWSFAIAFGDAFVAEQPHTSCSCSSSNNWPYTQHLLLGMITSVILVVILVVVALALQTFFLPTTHCGMELGVVPPAPAAHSTTLHGSARPSPSPPLMTWRSGSVIAVHIGTHLSSSWRFLCNKSTCTYKFLFCILQMWIHKQYTAYQPTKGGESAIGLGKTKREVFNIVEKTRL